MTSFYSDDFITSKAWYRAVVGGRDMILRRTSALEFMELFSGYMHEKRVDVYAKKPGEFDNFDYCIVDSYDVIDYNCFGNVLCTTVNQTFNDMLSDFDNIDEQSLVEGLSRYYYTHGASFGGLRIKPENVEGFSSVKDWAIEYYYGG